LPLIRTGKHNILLDCGIGRKWGPKQRDIYGIEEHPNLLDALAQAGIPAYGPKADGARLEASKIFTKQILFKYKIPTAPAGFFTEIAPALAYLRTRPIPIVIKADGLAAGKGVIVAQTHAEAEEAVRAMLEGGKFRRKTRRTRGADASSGHRPTPGTRARPDPVRCEMAPNNAVSAMRRANSKLQLAGAAPLQAFTHSM